jgi:cysteine sulfinate desulfinase/cysteine desulfurase-like protein
MKKPDRFARMVDKLVGNHDGVQRMGITNAGAALLLRRQHRAVVRLVKQQERYGMGVHIMMPKQYGIWINAEELLAALNRRAK